MVSASRAFTRFALQIMVATNMGLGKPLPSSIATLSLGPDGFLLTKSDLDQPDVEVSHDSESVRLTSSLSLSEDTGKEAQLLLEAQAELGGKYQRGGEMALYAMFMRVAGRKGLLFFVFLLSIFVVGITYPREFPFFHDDVKCSGSLHTSTWQKFTSRIGSCKMQNSSIVALALSRRSTWV